MGILDGAVNEQELMDGLLKTLNVLLSRIEDEVLAKKRVVITVELVDKEDSCRKRS